MQKYVTHEKFSAFLTMDGEVFTYYSLKKKENIYCLKIKPLIVNLLNLLLVIN